MTVISAKEEKKKNPFCFNHLAIFFFIILCASFTLNCSPKIMFLFRSLSEKLCCNIFISCIAVNLKNKVLE